MIDIKNNRFELWYMIVKKGDPDGYQFLRSSSLKAKTLTAMHKEINNHACPISDYAAAKVVVVLYKPGTNETWFIGTAFEYPKQSISMDRLKRLLTSAELYLSGEV